WELNHRIRQAGEVVWFVPELRVGYRPRSSFRALARQFHGSGRWRREVVRVYPDTASVRYLAPPAAVLGSAVGAVAAVVGTFGGPSWLRLGAVLPLGYAAVVTASAASAARTLPPTVVARLPAVLATMHLSWGAGF